MNSRKRAELVFNHKEADRPLIDFGGTVVSSITSNAYSLLREFLGLEYSQKEKISDYMMGIVIPAEDILNYWNVDFRRIGPYCIEPSVKEKIWEDSWGIRRIKAGSFDYFDVVESPLEKENVDLSRFQWPELALDDTVEFGNIGEKAKSLFENSDYCIVGDMAARGILGTALRLRGYQRFMIDMISDPGLAKQILEKILNNHLNVYTEYLKLVGKYIHVICFGDDYGTQDRMVMSPKLFRGLFKPVLHQLFSRIKELTDAKLFFHCCGSIYPIIEDLIEIGIDILNPIQPQAKDMDPIQLKKEFGERIVLWGGIDVQGYLINGSSDLVSREVKDLVKVMVKDGGYVAAPSHNIQEDIPCENIISLYNSLNQLSKEDLIG